MPLFAGMITALDNKGYPPHSYFKYVKSDENFYIFELKNDTDEGLDDYYQLYCK